MRRCGWAGTDPLLIRYHDEEWGVPVHDDRRLFEFLVLEGMQAGLSWRTILYRREAFRRAFAGFDPAQVAGFTDADVARQADAVPVQLQDVREALSGIDVVFDDDEHALSMALEQDVDARSL